MDKFEQTDSNSDRNFQSEIILFQNGLKLYFNLRFKWTNPFWNKVAKWNKLFQNALRWHRFVSFRVPTRFETKFQIETNFYIRVLFTYGLRYSVFKSNCGHIRSNPDIFEFMADNILILIIICCVIFHGFSILYIQFIVTLCLK